MPLASELIAETADDDTTEGEHAAAQVAPAPRGASDDGEEHAGIKPPPEAERAALPPPRAARHKLSDELKAMKAELESLKAEKEQRGGAERETRDSEMAAMREEIRAAREEARAAASRPRADDTAAADKEYERAIADLRKQYWQALEAKDGDRAEELADARAELIAERKFARLRAEDEANRPAALPPEVEAMEREFNDIQVKSNWRQTVAAWDTALAASMPAGLPRYRKAFEQAAISLGVRKPTNGDGKPSAAQAARTLPTGGGAGGAGANGGGKTGRLPPGWQNTPLGKKDPDAYKRIWFNKHPEMIDD